MFLNTKRQKVEIKKYIYIFATVDIVPIGTSQYNTNLECKMSYDFIICKMKH